MFVDLIRRNLQRLWSSKYNLVRGTCLPLSLNLFKKAQKHGFSITELTEMFFSMFDAVCIGLRNLPLTHPQSDDGEIDFFEFVLGVSVLLVRICAYINVEDS